MKTTLHEGMIENLTKFVRSGTYMSVAAENCGVSERTLYRWLESGEKTKHGNSPHRQLCQAITRARADVETERVAKLRDYGMGTHVEQTRTITRANGDVEVIETFGGDWRALAFLLERQYPERWGKREQIALTGAEGKPLQPLIVVLPNEQPMIYPRGNGHDPDEMKLLNIGKPPNASTN